MDTNASDAGYGNEHENMTEQFISLSAIEQDAQREETPPITLWPNNMSWTDRLILIWHIFSKQPYTFENPVRELSGIEENGGVAGSSIAEVGEGESEAWGGSGRNTTP